MAKNATYNCTYGRGRNLLHQLYLNNRVNNKVIGQKITSFSASIFWSFLIWFGDYYEY